MKMTLRYGWIVAAMLLVHYASSQENYLPGYIIQNDGDTSYGLVDYRNWEKNPRAISFKAGMEEEPAIYRPMASGSSG